MKSRKLIVCTVLKIKCVANKILKTWLPLKKGNMFGSVVALSVFSKKLYPFHVKFSINVYLTPLKNLYSIRMHACLCNEKSA